MTLVAQIILHCMVTLNDYRNTTHMFSVSLPTYMYLEKSTQHINNHIYYQLLQNVKYDFLDLLTEFTQL